MAEIQKPISKPHFDDQNWIESGNKLIQQSWAILEGTT